MRWSKASLFLVLFSLAGASQQSRPDYSGNWILDSARSGPEPDIWLQHRPMHLVIRQNFEELTIDTGDGSLFGVRVPVVEDPLQYKFDGAIITVVDHSLGDIPNFTRKISTEASWENNSRLWTFTTHSAEANGRDAGTTRVLILSMTPDHELKVERTGYRGRRPDPASLFGPLPKYLHNGRIEDDRAYAKDIAFYKNLL
jgi:hypothetical protein